ncbi:MAG: hypothetical protein KAQ87_00860 [Candidatus Pacebacteria bacterium]|nr:hypothetical protein [Candidatus Paceibacterota bacterium]
MNKYNAIFFTAMFFIIAFVLATTYYEKATETEFITEDELPEGYILQIRTEDYFENFGKVDSVRISHGPHLIRLGESYITDKGTVIKFLNFSDSGEINLSIDRACHHEEFVVLREPAVEIPGTDFYVSYKDLKRNSIFIRWTADLQKNESITLSSGQTLTFVKFVNSTAMFKLE